jgi:hypothetical protein
MRLGLLVVQSRPAAPDRADEYHDWYDNIHLPAVLSVPGVVSARRFRACDRATGRPDDADPSFLAVYELEADDLAQPLKDMRARTAGTEAASTDAIQLDPPPVIRLYEAWDGPA